MSQRLAREYREKAEELRRRFNAEWWDSAHNRFYAGILPDGSFYAGNTPECLIKALWFGIPEEGAKTEAALDRLEQQRPAGAQALSYYPDLLYGAGRSEAAYAMLFELASPEFFGRDVGEPAFAVIGAIGTGLMDLSRTRRTHGSRRSRDCRRVWNGCG